MLLIGTLLCLDFARVHPLFSFWQLPLCMYLYFSGDLFPQNSDPNEAFSFDLFLPAFVIR